MNNSKYKLNYNFGENFNEDILEYMSKIMQNSNNNFMAPYENETKQLQSTEDLKKATNEARILNNCIKNLEEYLYFYYYLYHNRSPETFRIILNSLRENVHTISFLPEKERGIYGKIEPEEKTIYINPYFSNKNTLTGTERRRLYMAHELGHIVNKNWMDKVSKGIDKLINNDSLEIEEAHLFYNGFSMLDEVTTQNQAELFAYTFAKKDRPKLTKHINPKLFDSNPYKTNFDFYGELQESAIMFAKTLKGIRKEKSDEKSLDILSERALSPNFFDNILDEYKQNEQIQELILASLYMGCLKRASYASFGYDEKQYLEKSTMFLNGLSSLTTEIRNQRETSERDR